MYLALSAINVQAHKPSDSYLSLNVEGVRLQGQWDIALRDLDYAIGLDTNDDGAITWGELRGHHTAVEAYALSRLHIRADSAPCSSDITAHLVDTHTDGAYAVLRFNVECPRQPNVLELDYSLLFDLDPQHRGLLQVTSQGQTRTAVFSPEQASQRLDLTAMTFWGTFRDLGHEGIWHIWTGFDHILFLLALLLPAVLRREAGSWQAVPRFRPACGDVFKIVTAFTLAHSMTLSLATLGVVHLPSRWIESAIAASVILAALNNVYPLFPDQGRWAVGFAFGLLHGFGFASVLVDLGLPRGALLLALVRFNVGVEAGQLAIVGTFLPLAYGLRRSWFYQRFTLVLGSLVVAMLSSVWFVERMFRLDLLSY
jgi:hypothetical protein